MATWADLIQAHEKNPRKTDFLKIGGRELVSLQCLAQVVTEANVLSHLIKHVADWPIPFYRKKVGSPIYIERYAAEEILAIDTRIRTTGKNRSMEAQPGKNTSEYGWALHRECAKAKAKFWSSELHALRGKQTRIGSRNLICNPPLPWPSDEVVSCGALSASVTDVKTLTSAVGVDSVLVRAVSLTRSNFVAILKYDKAARPLGLPRWATERQRTELIKRCGSVCQICYDTRTPLIDRAGETDVEHAYGSEEVVEAFMSGRLTKEQAIHEHWKENNLRAAHSTCNRKKHHMKGEERKRRSNAA